MKPKHDKKALRINAFFCTLLTFAVAGLLYFVFVNISFFNPLEKAFQDFEFTDLYYSESLDENSVSGTIILVNVQKGNREEIAKAIETVALQNPKVIALDLVFKDLKESRSDSLLKEVLHKFPNIVTSYYKEGDTLVESHPYFDLDLKKSGFINLYPKKGKTVIRDYSGMDISEEKDTLYSFASRIALEYDNTLYKKLHKFSSLFPIDYTANQEHFFTFDFDELAQNESVSVMKDAIVVFGYLGTPTGNPFDIEDKHFTPLNPEIAGKSAPDMYGAVVHSNVIKMLINNNFLFKISAFWTFCIAFIISFYLILTGMRIDRKKYFFGSILKKIIQLLVPVFLIYFAVLLLKIGILIYITPVILLGILSLVMIEPYYKTVDYLKKKFL